MLIRSSHGFLSSVFFVSFLFSGRYFGGLFHSRACLNTWGPPWTNVLAGKSTSASENQKFDVRLVLSWSNGSGDANFANNRTYSINKDLLSSLPTWNGNNILFEFPVGPLRRPRQLFLALKRSNAKNARVRTIQIQQQHFIACLLATWYLNSTLALWTIALNLLFVLMVFAKHYDLRNQETHLTSLLLIACLWLGT